MKFKKNVMIKTKDGKVLVSGTLKKTIEQEDIDIVMLLLGGITDDDMLIDQVKKIDNGDEYQAGLRLAQFVEDYGEFLEEGLKSTVFET
ncbi:MAG: hypothetical protein IJ796_07940 [Lachnospiraceae bacterium]|nr:hypothetical protein [Lachnospiraceae bacterium]